MKRRLVTLFLSLCLLLSLTPFVSAAEEAIVILYENDVHGAIEGYSKIAAMKAELRRTYTHVGVVSIGDFVQGSSLCAVSQGEYIVNAMNMVGYDAIALGNHEFDYRLERLYELVDKMTTKPVCANFRKIGESASVFAPYSIVSYGDTDIAFVGVTTPHTLTSSSPSQFMDENGDYLYTFHASDLYDTVQTTIDDAKQEGADYIIALTHLGTEYVNEAWSAQALVANTDGFDAVLDGHSHSVEEQLLVRDKSGDDVPISSTGTQFAHIGKLTVGANGDVQTTLIPTETYEKTDAAIDGYIEQIRADYATLGERKIGESRVDLHTHDANGDRVIRTNETNLGDFCADAFRVVTGADVGVINGGGIRADMKAGDVTFNDILNVFPFNNTVCVAEVTGQQLLDLLEMGVMMYPEENGSFQHVSGVTFTLDDSIPSPVVMDENDVFVGVDGARRVNNVRILDSNSGTYQPLDPAATYKLASHNYLLMEHGSGASMLDGSPILVNNGLLDVELLELYITDHLGGAIGEEYAVSQNRITVGTPIHEGDSPQTGDASETALWWIVMGLGISACLPFLLRRKNQCA